MDWRGAAKGGTEVTPVEVPLRQRLAEIRAKVEALIPSERMAPIERAVAELAAAGLVDRILPVGASAPAFELSDQSARMVSSASLLASGPLIIVLYRGRWCPYDVATLEAWNQRLPEIQAAGAHLVAISPQKPQHTFFTADQHKLQFPVLSDSGNAIARQFGLVYRLPDYLEQHYRRIFVNLPNSNGDHSWELPVAATYVISASGKVAYAHADPDFRLRAEPAAIIQTLAI